MSEDVPGYPEITVDRNVPMALPDGVKLYADVYRPKSRVRLPVLLSRLPYDKTEAGANLGYAHPAWYAAQGYVVAIQDVRGRWASEGTFYPFLHEAGDGQAAITWASQLPGSDGQVGMYGFSYGGAAQLLAAVSGPPELNSICPGFTWSQPYEGCLYTQGAFNLAFAAGWAVLLAQETALRYGQVDWLTKLQQSYRGIMDLCWTLPLSALSPFQGGHAQYFADWLTHSHYDDYWSRWSIEENYSGISIPCCHIGGWYDAFIKGTVKNFLGLKEKGIGKQKLLVGPWWHMPWNPLVDSREQSTLSTGPNVVDDWQIRWFDWSLKGRSTGVLDSPVTVFQMGQGWLDLDNWPPRECRPTSYFLHSRGRANSAWGDGFLDLETPLEEPPDIFVYSPHVPVQSAGGHSCCRAALAPMGAADQFSRESSNCVLVYTGPVLVERLSLMGAAHVILFAASSAVDTDFTARLCRVDRTGRSTNIAEGIIRARFRESLRAPSPITPGKVYSFHVDLGPICVRIEPGEQIRLAISSSDFPMWDRNQNNGLPVGNEQPLAAVTATQTVLHTAQYPSQLILPVVS